MGWKFNPFTGKLDFVGAGGGGSPTGPAGGDLAGTYPNPTVDGLQGRPVSNATPVNGQVLQYDGTNWVPGSIPSGGSGGGGVVYFLNFNIAADAPVTNIPQTPNTTKELGIIAEAATTSYTSPILSTASYDFLASFVTDLNVPAATAIPAGLWDFNIWAESTTTNTSNHILYKIEVLKYDGVNAPVLLATSADNYIYDPQDITQYVTSIVLPQTTILATDRIVVYLYGKATQNNNTITFHFGGQYPSHTHSTMPSVTGTGVVKVINGVFQSPASTIVDTDVSATANIAQSKIANLTTDLAGKVSKSGDTMTGKLTAPADATISRLNIGPSLALPSPATIVDGDIWITNQNKLAFRSSGTTINTAGTNQANTFSQPQTIGSTSNAAAVLTASNTGTREVATFTNTISATSDAVVITNLGSGNSLVVNDDVTPDSTRFAVSNTGRVGVGVTPDSTVALSVDSTGIKFSDNSIQTTAAVAGVTSVTATAPLTSSGGATPDISTSIATNRIVGRSTAGTGVMEELTPVGITVSGGNITGIGGTVGTVDNAVPRADGVGGFTVQGSEIIIGDATTLPFNNVIISNNHSGQTDSSITILPKGNGALIYGTGGNARGDMSVDLQRIRFNANEVCTAGHNTIIAGYGNRNNAYFSGIVAGQQNVVTGQWSFIGGGQANSVTGAQSAVVGGINANCNSLNCGGVGGNQSILFANATFIGAGEYARADRYSMQAHAAGSFTTTSGQAQRARFVLRCKTTTNAAVEMALDGGTTYLGIPSGKVIACTINISGVKSDGSAVAHYVRQYAVKNVGGTSSEVYAPVTIGTDNAAGTVIALSANNGDDTLRIAVTGIAAETWRWVASVDAVEIAYGT